MADTRVPGTTATPRIRRESAVNPPWGGRRVARADIAPRHSPATRLPGAPCRTCSPCPSTAARARRRAGGCSAVGRRDVVRRWRPAVVEVPHGGRCRAVDRAGLCAGGAGAAARVGRGPGVRADLVDKGASGGDPAAGTVHAVLAALCRSGLLFLPRRGGFHGHVRTTYTVVILSSIVLVALDGAGRRQLAPSARPCRGGTAAAHPRRGAAARGVGHC